MLKDYIVVMSQKDLHKLGVNLGAVRLGYNFYLYENDLHTQKYL